MALSSQRARALGAVGLASRWARTVDPDARRAATAKARAQRWANLVARAEAMAAERRETLTPKQVKDRALHLQRLDLARARLRQKAGR